MAVEVLDRQLLNRATLERQLLLRRQYRKAIDAISHLIALQAQEPLEPYVGLWSRITDFEPPHLVDLLAGRRVVRTLLMRRTLHLVTSEDCLELRPLHDAMLVARMKGTLGRRLPGVDFEELAAAGAPLFAEMPRTLSEVGGTIEDRWPGASRRDLGDALSTLVPLVQIPPRGIWGQRAPARNTTVEVWLGRRPEAPAEALENLVLRYLQAYGPASSADIRAWSGLSGLPAVIKELRPRLQTFRDERRRELLDVPGAPLPNSDTQAPVRFLPAFDNAVLGYDDRSRIIDDEHRGLSVQGARFVLIDGRVAGVWTSSPADGDMVEVAVAPLRRISKTERTLVGDEAQRLSHFLADGRPGLVKLK